MFEKASRIKLRFSSAAGHLSAEDLWSIPLKTTKANQACLDDIARDLHGKLKDDTVSFVEQARPNEIDQLRFDIVKHVIKVRLEENATENLARANREKKQRILELIAQKQDAQLANQSLEELTALANSL